MIETNKRLQSGFSLIELMIAMTVTLLVLSAASMLLSKSFSLRITHDRRSDALADAQRAINIMSRELASAGYGLANTTTDFKGIVAADSKPEQIRFRADLNNNLSLDSGEDVTYFAQSGVLYRYDKIANQTLPLANEIDTLAVKYYDASGTNLTPAANTAITAANAANVVRINLSVSVLKANNPTLAADITLASDVVLRNSANIIPNY
jgi:prepilin-type N-terminal cleavage/methylation domain-containing protein